MRKTACRSLMCALLQTARNRLRQVDYARNPSCVKMQLTGCGYGSPSRPLTVVPEKANYKSSLEVRKTCKKFFHRTKSAMQTAEISRICEADLRAATRDMQTSSARIAC